MKQKTRSVIKLSQEVLIGETVTEELIKATVEMIGEKLFPGQFDREACVTELKRRNKIH